jgi:thiamine pyrophosphokinase
LVQDGAVSEIRFGTGRSKREGRRRAAVLALEGASRADLARSLALAAAFDVKPILVAVDGGLATFRKLRLRPDLFVGDVDSARRVPRGIDACVYPVAKDFSDLSGGLRESRKLGAEIVVIAGFLGGRLDHEWANLLEVAAAARGFAGIAAPSSRGLVAITSLGLRARTRPRKPVSVFAMGGGARVTVRGASWELVRKALPPGSLGLSNVTGTRLSVDVHQGVVAVVFPDAELD